MRRVSTSGLVCHYTTQFIALTALTFGVLVLLSGCSPPYVPPQPGPGPTPIPFEPPPIPSVIVPPGDASLDVFEAVKKGDPESVLSTLPPPSRTTTLGGRTLRAWDTRVPRPDGGFVAWHIDTEAGAVVASYAW